MKGWIILFLSTEGSHTWYLCWLWASSRYEVHATQWSRHQGKYFKLQNAV